MFKYLILLMVSMNSKVAISQDFDSQYTAMLHSEVKPGECINYSFEVINGIDPTHYQIATIIRGQVVSRGFIEVSKTRFARPGRAVVRAKYLASKELQMTKFGFWKECE